MSRLTVVIPTRDEPMKAWEQGNVSVRTLREQTFRDIRIITVWDAARRGAGWARNTGFAQVASELVLFSDDDIAWHPDALKAMVQTLDAHPDASFCYGAYRCNWRGPEMHTISWQEWDRKLLRKRNYISTMSVIRAADFPGFDESLPRYQDWDLWLTMSEQGKRGVFCGAVLFETTLKPDGVTWGSIPIDHARAIIARKHKL